MQLESAGARLWFGGLSAGQADILEQQIQAAEKKGLKSRYWGEPHGRTSLRDTVLRKLMEFGVGMLNVEDLMSAASCNPDWCVVAGLALCEND